MIDLRRWSVREVLLYLKYTPKSKIQFTIATLISSYSIRPLLSDAVAESIEHVPRVREIVGSNPGVQTNDFKN